jgi:hypothetical protein
VRRECLDRLLIFGRRQLEHVLRVYIRHFNQQRPHRALDLRPPERCNRADPSPTATPYPLRVRRRDLVFLVLSAMITMLIIVALSPALRLFFQSTWDLLR